MAAIAGDGSCQNCGRVNDSYTPQSYHLPPSTVLQNRYMLGRVLGEGGFGITYIGRDLRLDMKIAVKEYYPKEQAMRNTSSSTALISYGGNTAHSFERGKKRFLSEARTLAKLIKHKTIVGVSDFFEENNTAYIVMEYIEGTTFHVWTEQWGGRIPAEELFRTVKPLFPALSAVHDLGLIHRDISPDNLMLEHGEVRLLDFGCAKGFSNESSTMTVALKHGFAPLEQYTSQGQGPWTDVYALCATLYYCLTGITPARAIERLRKRSAGSSQSDGGQYNCRSGSRTAQRT